MLKYFISEKICKDFISKWKTKDIFCLSCIFQFFFQILLLHSVFVFVFLEHGLDIFKDISYSMLNVLKFLVHAFKHTDKLS